MSVISLLTSFLENKFDLLTKAIGSLCFVFQHQLGFPLSPARSFSVPIPPLRLVPTGLTSDTTDAANPDNTAAPAHRGAPAKGGGRGSRREAAEISGTEPGGCHPLQTEEEGLGDVTGKESRRTHPDKHAASGAGRCLFPRDSKALCTVGISCPRQALVHLNSNTTEQLHAGLLPKLYSRRDTAQNKISIQF